MIAHDSYWKYYLIRNKDRQGFMWKKNKNKNKKQHTKDIHKKHKLVQDFLFLSEERGIF